MAVNRTKTDQYQLRLPPGLRDELREAAELHSRSMNAEIVERLEQYPILVRLPMDISYLKMENERLTEELAAARATCDELRANNFALQKLLDEHHEDARRGEETLSIIEDRFNDLRKQAAYLEELKAELRGVTGQMLKDVRQAILDMASGDTAAIDKLKAKFIEQGE